MTDDVVPNSLEAARVAEEARRVDDDYLSELQRVWQAESARVEMLQRSYADDGTPQTQVMREYYGLDAPSVADAGLALIAEVKRLRAEKPRLTNAPTPWPGPARSKRELIALFSGWLEGHFSTRDGVAPDALARHKWIREDFERAFREDWDAAKDEPGRVTLNLTHDQISMVHHALANLGSADPLKRDAFRELFDMVRAHVQASTP